MNPLACLLKAPVLLAYFRKELTKSGEPLFLGLENLAYQVFRK